MRSTVFLIFAILAGLLAAPRPALADRPPVFTGPPAYIVFFVDYSGSMNLQHYLSDEPKIVMAKKLLANLIHEIPDGRSNVSIVMFSPWETILPDAPLDQDKALASLDKIRTDFDVLDRRTTLGKDIERLARDIEKLQGSVSVLMLTDGYSNFGPAPLDCLKKLHERFGDRVALHFVSYAGQDQGRRELNRLRRIDPRGAFCYGDTLLLRQRDYDQLVQTALLHFPSDQEPPEDLPAASPDEMAGLAPPVSPAAGVGPAGAKPGEPEEALNLVVGLAAQAAGPAAGQEEQVVILRPKSKTPEPQSPGPELLPGLVYILAVMDKYPGLGMTIETHTDSLGDELDNMEICRRWGRVIRNWLTQRGVQAVRLSIEPFGETRPAFDNADEWGRRLNRRILFRAKLPGGAP